MLTNQNQVLITGLTELVSVCHRASVNAGWWNGVTPDIETYVVGTKFALIHSEVSEAMEGYRKDLMDDKLPNRKMVEVELADALIRIGDLAGRLGLDLGNAVIEKMAFNAVREDHKLEVREQANGKRF